MTRSLTAVLVGAVALAPGANAQQSTDASVGTHDGITVIHREIEGSRVVAAEVYLLGGPGVAGSHLAGIEPLFLNVASRGSVSFPGQQSQTRVAALGAEMYVSPNRDWTAYGFLGLASDFEELWTIFADRLTAPELKPEAVEMERSRALAPSRAGLDDPESRAASLAIRAAFRGHPYGLPLRGDKTTLGGITADTLRAFQERYLVKSRLLVVVVGGVTREDAVRLVEGTLGSLPQGSYSWAPPPPWSVEEPTMSSEAMSIPTNYVRGIFGGPPSTHEDYAAFQLAVGLLSGLISSEIREEGLSYSAGVTLLDMAASGGSIYVSTSRPERCMEIVEEWIEVLQSAIMRRSAIRNNARNSLMSYFIQNETPERQTEFLARSFLNRGRVQSLDAYIEELHDVDPAAVRRMARDYFENIRWVFVGNPSLMPTSVGGDG